MKKKTYPKITRLSLRSTNVPAWLSLGVKTANSVKCGREPQKNLVELEFGYVLSNYYFQGQNLTFTFKI